MGRMPIWISFFEPVGPALSAVAIGWLGLRWARPAMIRAVAWLALVLAMLAVAGNLAFLVDSRPNFGPFVTGDFGRVLVALFQSYVSYRSVRIVLACVGTVAAV